MSELTDLHLVEAYRNGDTKSFEILLRRNQNKLFSYILMLVHDRSQAEDLFQDVCFKMMRLIKNNKYTEKGKFINFAYCVAHNLVMDSYRRGKRLPIVEGTETFNPIDVHGMTDNNVEENIIESQTYETLSKMVDHLSADQREILMLRFYDNLSFKEIAKILGISINTALGRMRYAIINLRKMVKDNNIDLSLE